MSEGERKIILSSTMDEKPSREKRKEAEAKEKKEKLKARELIDKAVVKLKALAEKLPQGSKEKARADHTLLSVEGALQLLGKNGAPEGKVRVKILDHEGKQAVWPDGKEAMQDEGVPVDELIDILKNQAKALNEVVRNKKNLTAKKKEADELWERYEKAKTTDLTGTDYTKGATPKDKVHHDKAWVYSQWEKTKKEYEEMQEGYDLGFTKEGKELDDLAEELYKRSETHFKLHHGHELPLNKDESDKQNVRTKYEAYLISKDSRRTGSESGDYKAGMDAMGKRREFVVKDEEEVAQKKDETETGVKKDETPKEPEEPKHKLTNTNEPYDWENNIDQIPEEPKKSGVETPKRVAIVNAEAQVELLARERAGKRLTEMLNNQSKVKRWWYRAWEQGYRQQLIEEERKKILGQENKPGWFKRKFFGAKTIEATGKKNLFAGTGNEAENQAELSALATRFASGLQRESEGEQKKQLEDPEFNTQINDLVFAYATGSLSDGEFEQKKDVLVSAIAKKYPGSFADGKLTADNFLETAKEFKKIHEHSKGLARTDVSLSVDLGLAKESIKTKANLNWVDKLITKVQKYPVIGHVVTPGTVGFGASIVGFFSKKPLYWLGGAAVGGGILGGMRRNAEQKRDLEMHRMERAMGNEIGDYGSGAKRRAEMEKFVYEMRSASDISIALNQANEKFEQNPSAENAKALTTLLAETEARMSLSETRQRDLISYDGESALERGRLFLMKELAEAKVKLQKQGFDSNVPATQEYKNFMKTLGGDMEKLDSKERKHRWKENAKAAAIGAVGGLVVGGLAQEAAAQIADHVSWASWMRPGGKATSAERLYHYIKGDMPTAPSGGHMVDSFKMPFHGGETAVKVDSTMELVKDPASGFWNLVDKSHPGNILGKMDIDPVTGKMTPIPGTYDAKIINFSEHLSTSKGGGGSFIEQIKTHLTQGKVQKIDGRMWNDNPFPGETTHAHNLNELRFYPSLDASGDIHLKVPIQEGESWLPGGKMADIGKAFSEGRIKMLFVPDGNHPGEAIVLDVDPVTKEVVLPKGDVLQNLWDPKTLKFKGGAFGLAENTDGNKFAWISSDKGAGSKLQEIVSEQVERTYELGRTGETQEWWGPWMWAFKRKALETEQAKKEGKKVIQITKKGETGQTGQTHEDLYNRLKNGGTNEKIKKDSSGEYVVGKDGKKIFIVSDKGIQEGDWFGHEQDAWGEESKKLKETFKKDKTVIKKGEVDVGVLTRGQKIEKIDQKDYSPNFVGNFKGYNPKEVAELLVTTDSRVTPADAVAMEGMDDKERKVYLEKKVLAERQKYEAEAQTKEISEYLTSALKAVDMAFADFDNKDAPVRNPIIAKEKIHLMGLYDYMAHSSSVGKTKVSGGCCWVNNATGDIYVNMYALEKMTPEQKMITLKHVVAHEAVHGSVANNFWGVDKTSDDAKHGPKYKQYMWRRSGLVNVRLEKMSSGLTFTERGRALNEAVTEELSIKAMEKLFGKDSKKYISKDIYKGERDVLELMQKKFGINFEDFAKAAIDRRALPELVRKVEGYKKEGKKTTVARPRFMPLVMGVMDYEMQAEKNGYNLSKALVEGKPVVMTQEMLAFLPVNLLELSADGNLILRKDVLDNYPNIKIQIPLKKAA